MRMSCVYAKTDGLSYLADVTLDMKPHTARPSAIGAMSDLFPLTGWTVFRLDPGGFRDWHINPTPAISALLTGSVLTEVGGGGGQQRVSKPGDVSLSMDALGQGHRTRVVGDEPAFGFALRMTEAQFRGFLEKVKGLPPDSVLPTSW